MFQTNQNLRLQVQQLQDQIQQLQNQNQELHNQVQQLTQQLQKQQIKLTELKQIKQQCDNLSKLLENDAKFEEMIKQHESDKDQKQENSIKRPSTPQLQKKVSNKKSFESL